MLSVLRKKTGNITPAMFKTALNDINADRIPKAIIMVGLQK